MSARPPQPIDLRRLSAVGRPILERRRALRLDRHQVACLANVDDDMVAIIEDGYAEVGDVSAVLAVCRALGIDVTHLPATTTLNEA